ncbi:MAG: N-acetylmuramoyl-L-alanine amidase [Nitrospirae bacterium]|nr:N-acetylmuramoyl-L-alanine amidase [Nitrospirota bacterium]
MRKLLAIFLFVILPVSLLAEEPAQVKVRVNIHDEFLRIVFEGPEAFVFKGIVNQKGQDIIVNFQGAFEITDVKAPFTLKVIKNSVVFSAGSFKEMKTSFLKSPGRLVIDLYQETKTEVKKEEAKEEIKKEEPRKDVKTLAAKILEEEAKKGEAKKEETKPLKIRTIIIDPGHGGYEYGVAGKDYREKDVVLDISKRLRALLGKGSAQGILTRGSDQFMSLRERANLANLKKGQVFISLHIGRRKNIMLYTPVITKPTPKEIKSFLLSKGQEGFIDKSNALADAMAKAIEEGLGPGIAIRIPLPYSVLSKVEAAALMIELPSFDETDYNEDFKTKLVNIIYKGFYLYAESGTR